MASRLFLFVAVAGWMAACSASTAPSTAADAGAPTDSAAQVDAGKDAAATLDSGSAEAADTATAAPDTADATATDVESLDAGSDATAVDAQPSDTVELDAALADTADALDAAADLGEAADTPTSDLTDAAGDESQPADSAIADAAVADTAGTDMMATDIAGAATNVDLAGVVWTCTDPAWLAKTCAAGVVTAPPVFPGIHVDLPTPITYSDLPPSSGTHRPMWGKWGEYSFLPQQRWLHNLEHGGLALLYHPCAPQATIDALRAFAKAQPDDDGGPFRWVMTPYPNLPTAVALVGWGHLYLAECANPEDMKTFIPVGYRKAPEDEGFEGGYSELWIGK